MADHPMQPIEFADTDNPDRASFKPNKIVHFLMTFSRGKGIGLSELADMPWAQEDWDQFYQLIGISVSSYSDCSLVSDKAKTAAEEVALDGN